MYRGMDSSALNCKLEWLVIFGVEFRTSCLLQNVHGPSLATLTAATTFDIFFLYALVTLFGFVYYSYS